jgi:hypothetical protein
MLGMNKRREGGSQLNEETTEEGEKKKCYLRRIVGNANVASIADDAVNRVRATAQVVRLIPRQDDRRLVNEIDCQILRLGRRF